MPQMYNTMYGANTKGRLDVSANKAKNVNEIYQWAITNTSTTNIASNYVIALTNNWVQQTPTSTINNVFANFVHISDGNGLFNITYPDTLIDVDGNTVPIPYLVAITEEDSKWVAWVNEVAEEANKRQRAREIYNQEQQEITRKRALAEAERIAAQHKARVILFEHLTKEQQDSWTAHQLFYAEIKGERYKFTCGTHGNVYKMQPGTDSPIERFCIAPGSPHNGGALPVEDVILAQMLLLEADEEHFRKVANITALAHVPAGVAA